VAFDLTCHGCGEPFTAKSARAKWCKPGCKKRVQRNPAAAAEPVSPPDHEPETGLVAALRKELEDAGVLATVEAQQALVLARSMAKIDATAISSLSKELSRVKAAALGVSEGEKPAAEPAGVADPDDEIRKRRDAKRQAAREASS
jgi:hypothetical protein